MRALGYVSAVSGVVLRQPFVDYLTLVLVYVKLTSDSIQWFTVVAPIGLYIMFNVVLSVFVEYYKNRLETLNIEAGELPSSPRVPLRACSNATVN